KAKEKPKEKAKGKERKAKKDKSSYSYEESSEGSAKRRQARRAEAGLKPASGFSLAPPPAAEPGFALATAALPAPVQNLLGGDVTMELLKMRQAVEAATGKVEPRLRLDQRE
ncbi:unnamed protein product, partial [Effrenium voratum]